MASYSKKLNLGQLKYTLHKTFAITQSCSNWCCYLINYYVVVYTYQKPLLVTTECLLDLLLGPACWLQVEDNI